jgi:hypothetical protein
LAEGFRSAFDAGSYLTTCRPEPPLDGVAAPNDNIAVLVAGMGSETTGDGVSPLYENTAALLGYAPDSIYRFSYRGAGGPALHEPYDRTDTYRDLRASAARLRALLAGIARRNPGRRVDLITHSQGGIIARTYLERLHRSWDPRAPVVDHLVTFATPHEGVPLSAAVESLGASSVTGRHVLEWLSQRARDGAPWPDPLSRAVAQLSPESRLLGALRREDVAYGTRVLALGIANDFYVPADRAVLETDLSRVVGPNGWWGHSGILTSASALAAAHVFLRDGRDSCRTGWDLWGTRAGAAIGWGERAIPWLYGELEQAILKRILMMARRLKR